jgi:hypothetical protein
MALAKGTNSYVTQVEADAYFADRLDVAAWLAADATQKEQALVTATAVLDGLRWTGIAVSQTQPLAFPRSGSYHDPRVGTLVTLDDTVPTRVLTATKELAYHLINNDGVLDDSGAVIDLSVGQISMTTVIPPSVIPGMVKRMITPLLLNAGSNSWWRAN